VLVGIGLSLVSCSPDTSAPTLPDEASVETPLTLEAPAEETAEAAIVAMVMDDTAVATVPPFTDIECLECHTNQERLVELAVVPEETESLNSGPG
jgi:hypothetical protein